MKKLLVMTLVLALLFSVSPLVAAANEAEELEQGAKSEQETEPELKHLSWVLHQAGTGADEDNHDESNEETEPDRIPQDKLAQDRRAQWDSLEKLSQNVEALAEIMQPKLDDVSGFSPLSLYLALLAMRPGLSEKGQQAFDAKLNPAGLTEEELQQALALMAERSLGYDKDDQEIKIWESNTLAIGDQSLDFHPDYLAGLKALGMGAIQGDLSSEEAFQDINALIAYYTHGLIDPLYSDGAIQEQVKKNLANILINTLYFRDSWSREFSPENTEDKTFYGQSGESQVPMMQGEKEKLSYLDTDTYTAVRKPYSSGADMLLLMPKQEVDEATFWALYKEARNSADWSSADFILTLPKWELSSQFSLNQILEDLELNNILKQDKDLRFFTQNDQPLDLGSAFQKVELKVNEEGTEAAIATVIEMELTAMPDQLPPVELVIDHPFIYAICDSGLAILQGLICDLP